MDPQSTGNGSNTEDINSPGQGSSVSAYPQDSEPQTSYNYTSLGNRFSVKKIGNKNIVTSFMGMLLLLAGLGAGLLLVNQQQSLNKSAQTDEAPLVCDAAQVCSSSPKIIPSGSKSCVGINGGVYYCCKVGQKIVGEKCEQVSLECGGEQTCFDAKIFGSVACNQGKDVKFCCKAGTKYNESLNVCF